LLQAFYTIRSERQLMEQLDYNLLFRWLVVLSMDAPCVGCDGPLQGSGPTDSWRDCRQVPGRGLAQRQARVKMLMSDEHFWVDGTLIDAWVPMKSFRPNGSPGRRRIAGGRSQSRA
jgi:hypothetical protein